MPESTTRSIIPRHDYIGGSAAATILGKNRYETRYDLWKRKTERIEIDLADNRHVQRGNLVEPIIEAFCKERLDPSINSEANWKKHDFGLAERRFEERSPDAQIMLMDKALHPSTGKPYIGGHPDGVGDEILWEFKTPTSRKLEEVIKHGLPDEWYYQLQHYMMISGLQRGCLAMWSWDRWEPYLIWVPADPFIHAVMREEYERFWTHVAERTEPSASAETQMEREHSEIVDDPEIEAAIEAYDRYYDMRYKGKEKQAEARAQLLTLARGRKTIITPRYRASIGISERYGKQVTTLTVRAVEKEMLDE